jgi:hypothetical protein
MSINLVPEHALPKSYYFDMEANTVDNYANRKQITPEFDRTFLLVTPISKEFAEIPLLVAPTEFGV